MSFRTFQIILAAHLPDRRCLSFSATDQKLGTPKARGEGRRDRRPTVAQMLRRLYGLLSGRKYVGADSIGNMYFERQHPKYPDRILRERVPAGGQNPADYDPDSVSGEWTHWLQGGGENDLSAHPTGWAQSGQPLEKVVIQDSEEDGPSGPLARPGTGLFEPPKAHGDAFKPQGWAPSSRPMEPVASQDAEEAPQANPWASVDQARASEESFKPKGWAPGNRPVEPVAFQDAEESPTDPLSRPGTGVFEEPKPSGDAFKPKGWRPG